MGLTDQMSMSKPNAASRANLTHKIGGKDFLDCFQCMKCTSGCTALKLLELKPHEIMKLVNLGFVEDLAASDLIWTCATCLKCVQRCPQKASPYHTIMGLRNLAVDREAKVPDGYLRVVSQILETGLMETPQRVAERKGETCDRGSLGLCTLNQPKQSFQASLMKMMEKK